MSDSRSAPPVILSARGLRRDFRDGARTLHVLKGVDLEVRAGETLAVQGPSGSGKSTLLHILGALDRPTAGTVQWRGRDLARIGAREAARLRAEAFGFVFQSFHLLPELSAYENVHMPARIGRGIGFSPAARAKDLLARVGLGGRARHRPAQLSGGERQRVALARALLAEPEVVFCDEPTGNLDAESREAVLRLMGAFREEAGIAFVVATHDERVASWADRRLHIVDGKLQDR